MCYHALSLAKHGFQVELVGYIGAKPHNQVVSNPNIRLVPVRTPPFIISDLFPRPLALMVKFVWMLVASLYCLLFTTSANCKLLMMQNPPGVPTMMVCYLASLVKGCAFVIDWHNYTHSILQLSNRLASAPSSAQDFSIRTALMQSFTGLAEWWEGYWGKKANWNLCVSKAMQRDLKRRWGIRALTVYDKAPAWIFRP
uniref:Glycosyltransferase subfamily 4-like N-terminal domain-containing protein n=1 Tax=Ditylenchus dipsaci TaxID=166011 RepID=A0A915CNA7_9BILA